MEVYLVQTRSGGSWVPHKIVSAQFMDNPDYNTILEYYKQQLHTNDIRLLRFDVVYLIEQNIKTLTEKDEE